MPVPSLVCSIACGCVRVPCIVRYGHAIRGTHGYPYGIWELGIQIRPGRLLENVTPNQKPQKFFMLALKCYSSTYCGLR